MNINYLGFTLLFTTNDDQIDTRPKYCYIVLESKVAPLKPKYHHH